MNVLASLRARSLSCDGVRWVAEQADQSHQALWAACPDIVWMGWYLGDLADRDGYRSPAHRLVVATACHFAGLYLHPHLDIEPLREAVALADRWASGEDIASSVFFEAYEKTFYCHAPALAASGAGRCAYLVVAMDVSRTMVTALSDIAAHVRRPLAADRLRMFLPAVPR